MDTFILNFGHFLNTTVVPFLIAIAFLVFMWNMTRYFIIGGANEQEHEKAKSTALYGIASFVLITCVWGIVNLFVYGFGFTSNNPLLPDYASNGSISNGGYGSSFNGFSTSGGGGGGFWSGGSNNTSGGSGGGGGYNPVGMVGGESNNTGGGGFWSLLFGSDTSSETNINTTGSEMGGNDYYYMNNNTNSGSDTYIPPDDWGEGANLSNDVENTQYYDDWGEGANLSNGSESSSENNTNENWDNYGNVDGSDTSISPDP